MNGVGSKIKSYFINLSSMRLFITIQLIMIAVFLTLNLIWQSFSFMSLMLRQDTQFEDYFMHIGFASSPLGTNIYEYGHMACFPPLAYLMYGFLARMGAYQAVDPTDLKSHQYVGQNMTIFVLYNLICIVLLVYAVSLYIKKKGFVTLALLPMILIFSYPIIFSSVQRGNSVLLTAILLSIALAWKDEQSKVKRELAMILIAVCAGLKIYPAVFGLMYLKEKRWKETVRLVIYGAVLFFVPFAFFGGFSAIGTFFNTVFGLFGDIHPCSVAGFTAMIFRGVMGNNASVFGTIIQQVYLVLAFIAFFCAKTKRAEVLILSSLITVYVSSNWMYTCVYMLPALLMHFKEKDEQKIKIGIRSIPDISAFLMLVIVFSRPFYAGYMVIYGSIIIISILYHWITIAISIYHLYKRL